VHFPISNLIFYTTYGNCVQLYQTVLCIYYRHFSIRHGYEQKQNHYLAFICLLEGVSLSYFTYFCIFCRGEIFMLWGIDPFIFVELNVNRLQYKQ